MLRTLYILAFILPAIAMVIGSEVQLGSKGHLLGTRLREGANSFALTLLKQLSSKHGTLVASPWSLTSALLLLREGARGKSAHELQTTLGLPEDIRDVRSDYSGIVTTLKDNESKNVLQIANAIFQDKTFTPLESFTQSLRATYNSSVETVDFHDLLKAVSAINGWADKHTNGLIKEIVSTKTVSAGTKLVLANAVFFKGVWKHPFIAEATTEENFYPDGHDKEAVSVPMMKQQAKLLYADVKHLKSQALVLPYDSEKFYMLILLPHEDSNVDEVISKMSSVDDILNEMSEKTVSVSLPRFKIESKLHLNNALQELGVVDVFKGSANLTGISNSPLMVSDVIQKAVIEVNEEGTKAAAITAIVHTKVGRRSEVFQVDRPFLTLIAEKTTGIILFASKFSSPQ